MRLDMDDYSPQAKIYWWVTTDAGRADPRGLALSQVAGTGTAPPCCRSCWASRSPPSSGRSRSASPAPRPRFAGAEIFIFLLLLLHGPAACAVAAAAEAAVASWRTSLRWTSRIGSPTMAALAIYGCGTIFDASSCASRAGAPGWEKTALFGGLIAVRRGLFRGQHAADGLAHHAQARRARAAAAPAQGQRLDRPRLRGQRVDRGPRLRELRQLRRAGPPRGDPDHRHVPVDAALLLPPLRGGPARPGRSASPPPSCGWPRRSPRRPAAPRASSWPT